MPRLFSAFFSIFLCLLVLPASADDSLRETFLQASLTTIENNPDLSVMMSDLAESAIGEHCAACHGANLDGRTGVPSLTDWEWIWGINGDEVTSTESIMKIMQTILYGIRDRDCDDEVKQYGACPDTRYSEMPAYTELGFTAQQLSDLADYVLHISGQDADEQAVARAEAQVGFCTECHGQNLSGYRNYGGPDLTDDIWLYGGSREAILESISNGRMGVCPPYWNVLDAATVKALGVYIYRRTLGY